MDLISVQGVSKRYTKGSDTIQVLDDVSFQIQAGEMVSVIGASGAGKSTLLHVLGTLDAPDQGDILYKGRSLVALDPAELADFRNESLGFVFQFHHLLPEFSALENVMMPGLIARRGRKETRELAENAIEAVISGFCKDVFKQLPMEFAVDAQKLLTLKLEDSVG